MNKQVDSWLNRRLVAHKVETSYMIQIVQQTKVFTRHFSSVDISVGVFHYDQFVGGLGYNLKISSKVLEIGDQVEITT